MLTFQCYPHSVGVPCLAFSWLADEGITVGCDGDIESTMLVYVMQNLAQSASTYMEPVAIEEDKNTMIKTRDPLTIEQIRMSQQKKTTKIQQKS